MLNYKKLDKIFTDTLHKKHVHGASLHICQGDDEWKQSGGNLKGDKPHFIASTSKLYVTAIILQLKNEGKLVTSDSIKNYFSAETLYQLHIYRGINYSEAITIEQLMAHTSGLPDYFEDQFPDGHSLLDDVKRGIDKAWTAEETIAFSKQMKPRFAPGTKGKAHYSDTNYQLLGLLIESICRQKLEDVFQQRIIEPLMLKNTWLYTDPNDQRPADIFYKNEQMHLPHTMASFKADGGIVSTAAESMRFLKAFFGGKLFPQAYLSGLYQWNNIMFPLEYGVGLMRFKLPFYFSPLRKTPELLGHSGLSGAFAFYAPQKQCFLSGTVNQLHNPGTSFRLMMQCLDAISM